MPRAISPAQRASFFFFFLPTANHASRQTRFIFILILLSMWIISAVDKDKVSPDALTPPPLLLHSPVIYLP
jgi:hypothetical protein